jgi:Rha family phage regulatory protein
MSESNQDVSLQVIKSIHIENDHVLVSSKTIADHFGKSHKNVLQAIELIECSEDFRRLNFQPSNYTVNSGRNTTRTFKCYNITRDGFAFLAMGFTGKKAAQFKEAYINAFNKMEATITANQLGIGINPDNYHFPLETADPRSRQFRNAVMTPTVLLNGRKPELELLEQLEKDGFDVEGAKVRLESLYQLAEFQQMYNDIFNELYRSLKHVTELADKHRNTVWGNNVDFGKVDKRRKAIKKPDK